MAFVHLLVLLLMARALGFAAKKLGLPSVVGEIVAGVLAGGSGLSLMTFGHAFAWANEIAVFAIVFAAGLSTDHHAVLQAMRGRGAIVSLLGFTVPLLAGMALGAVLGLPPVHATVLGLCLSITALPVAIRLIESLGIVGTPVARYTISSAVTDDLAALAVLSAVVGFEAATLKVFAFAVAAILLRDTVKGGEAILRRATTAVFSPLFFAILGLQLRLDVITSPALVTSLIAVAVVAKVLAGVAGGMFLHFSLADSLKLGALMNGRGTMGVIIATMAHRQGMLPAELFASLILMSIVTTVAAPLIVRALERPARFSLVWRAA